MRSKKNSDKIAQCGDGYFRRTSKRREALNGVTTRSSSKASANTDKTSTRSAPEKPTKSKKAVKPSNTTDVGSQPSAAAIDAAASVTTCGGVGVVSPVISRHFDFEKAVAHLKSVDPKLGALMTPKSLVGFEERLLQADGSNPFRALSSSIIYQQISGKAAASIRAKFIALFDAPVPTDEGSTWFPTPEMVLDKTPEELRSAGLSGRKAEYIRDLAIKFVDKTIQPDLLDAMSDEEISKQLCSVKGIGQWTVDMYLMFNMRHPDVLPVTDLGIRKGLALHFNIPKGTTKRDTLPTPEQMRQVTEIWRPYRTLGCWYMWLLTDIYTVAD